MSSILTELRAVGSFGCLHSSCEMLPIAEPCLHRQKLEDTLLCPGQSHALHHRCQRRASIAFCFWESVHPSREKSAVLDRTLLARSLGFSLTVQVVAMISLPGLTESGHELKRVSASVCRQNFSPICGTI